MNYYLNRLQEAEKLVNQAKEEAERIYQKVEVGKRELPMDRVLEPTGETKALIVEGEQIVSRAASAVSFAQDQFLMIWRMTPENIRWKFYAWKHGLEIEDDNLIAFIWLRRDWPREGILDAEKFPAREKDGEGYYLVGSRELWKSKPPYIRNNAPFTRVKVLEGELPDDPADYVKSQRIEIVEVL